MRQFILGKNVATPTTGAVTAGAAGAVGFAYLNNGVMTFNNGTGITDKGYIVLKRNAFDGGDVVLPFYNRNFRYTKGEYVPATKFSATIIIPEPSGTDIDYTIIAVLKGVKFNERNKWTANIHLTEQDTPTTIGDKIVKYFMDGSVARYGLNVTNTSGTLAFQATENGVDWELIPADDLFGTTVTYNAHGIPAYGDAKYIADLAAKAAADAGFEYTYQDDVKYLYPQYPLNPLAQGDSQDTGFTIFTINFAEPREVKTVDQVINQIVQVAFPTGSDAISGFETVLGNIANA